MTDRCPDCGASYALVGRTHRCSGAAKAPEILREPVTPVHQSDCAVHNALPVGPCDCTSTYKYRDPGKRRAYQRDLMRKRRAKV